ncbi:conserved hypothetical protein, partial [Ricinus communis]
MYKTILVHVDGSAQQESRLRAAALLANEHEAHLVGSAVTGFSWRSYVVLAGSLGAGMIVEDFENLRRAAGTQLDQFKAQASRLGVQSLEARLVEEEAQFALLLQSRYADLVVVSQGSDPDAASPARISGLPEHLALRGTRPVLVVPDNYRGRPLASTVVVGWDGSMQAIRAINAALP